MSLKPFLLARRKPTERPEPREKCDGCGNPIEPGTGYQDSRWPTHCRLCGELAESRTMRSYGVDPSNKME